MREDGGVRSSRGGPRAHDDDARAHEDRLVDVVRDEQHGLLLGLPDAEQQLLHQLARLVVERAEGLVHEQDARAVGERARDRGALLHAARELLRKVVLEADEADLGDEAVRDLELLGARARRARAGRSRRCRAPSARERACSSGTPCRGRRRAPRCAGRRAAPRPRSAGRARRRCAAACSCRSPKGRGW